MKQLRQVSGAGMMDAKKALLEMGGDLDKALDFLRKKGLASADKKAGRLASEGAIGAYIHAGSRWATPSSPAHASRPAYAPLHPSVLARPGPPIGDYSMGSPLA